ncbi:MAG TPA: hypothetical protein VFF28_00040 [Candidatus Nanoarchaeia archaeon]|nr:hypothetical protein [Candidatus Nanoarchaeia archaeon]
MKPLDTIFIERGIDRETDPDKMKELVADSIDQYLNSSPFVTSVEIEKAINRLYEQGRWRPKDRVACWQRYSRPVANPHIERRAGVKHISLQEAVTKAAEDLLPVRENWAAAISYYTAGEPTMDRFMGGIDVYFKDEQMMMALLKARLTEERRTINYKFTMLPSNS